MIGDAFIVAARRTALTRVGGRLRAAEVQDLAASVIRTLLVDLDLDGTEVDDVLLGNCWGPGGNPARVAALAAGLPGSVSGVSIDQQCASGLAAINLAAQRVQSGNADVCLAGGAESVSTAPWRLAKPPTLYQAPVVHERASFSPSGLGDPDMGPAADALAWEQGIDRERQDVFSLASHTKALRSQATGRFVGEVVPVGPSGRLRSDDATVLVSSDEVPRSRLTIESLARLAPVFTAAGTTTAGNAAPAADGAALVAVVSESVFDALGRPPALRVAGMSSVGVDPRLPGWGPVAAVEALRGCEQLGDIRNLARIEFTEAFAGQALACLDALELDQDAVNVGGGAIALGHPWGASGAVLMVRLFHEMLSVGTPALGLATLAGAGGIGVASLVEVGT